MKPKRTPPSHAKPGIAHQHLLDVYSTVPPAKENLKEGHVILIFLQNDKSVTKTARSLTELYPGTCAADDLMKPLMKSIKSFKAFKNIGREREKINYQKFCNESFTFISAMQQEPARTTPERESDSDLVQVEMPGPFQTPSPQHKPQDVPGSSGRTPRLRGYLSPRKVKLHDRLNFVSGKRCSEKEKYKTQIKKLKEKLNIQKVNQVKYLNQDIIRKKNSMKQKDAKIVLLMKEIKELKKLQDKPMGCNNTLDSADCKKLQRKHKRIKQCNKKKRRQLASKYVTKEQYVKLQKELETKDELNKQFENQLCELQEKIAEMELEKSQRETKSDGKTYSTATRLEVFDHIVCQVPTQNIPSLMESSARRRGETLTSIPHRTTVEQMARELDSVADLKAAELAMKSKNITIAFDATTQEGTHINEIHITTETECEVIAIDELPGGTSDDYHDHVTSAVDKLADVYSDFHSEEFQYCRKQIINNITNSMSDRAAVNQATMNKVNLTWNKSLNQLNCHLHPLDTIASTCRSTLKSLETSKGVVYGKDCVIGNLVVQINKMRYKDGKGDPRGFKTFLQDNELPQGLIPRYRGNRLHILFHICGKLFHYRDLFLDFFSNGALSCGGLASSIKMDFGTTTAITEMQVLGLLGKLLSGPWMTKFYTAAEDTDLNHIDGFNVVKGVIDKLKDASTSPSAVLQQDEDFFENKLDGGDETLEKLRSQPVDQDLFNSMMSSCLTAIVGVLERQYKRYFAMSVTDQMKEETSSARLHNIDSEEIMGMYSANKERAKHASLDFLVSRMRARKNRVVPWLDQMYKERRERVVMWSVGRSRKKRQAFRKKEHEMKKEMSVRAANKRQQRSVKERKVVEKKMKDIDVNEIKTVFPDIPDDISSGVADILTGKIVGRTICHNWHDNDTGDQSVWSGKIEKLKKRKGNIYCYKIAYWAEGECYENAIDKYDIPKHELAADMFYGDLIVC